MFGRNDLLPPTKTHVHRIFIPNEQHLLPKYSLKLPTGLGPLYAEHIIQNGFIQVNQKHKENLFISSSATTATTNTTVTTTSTPGPVASDNSHGNNDSKIIELTRDTQKSVEKAPITVVLDRQLSLHDIGNESNAAIEEENTTPLSQTQTHQIHTIMTQIHERTLQQDENEPQIKEEPFCVQLAEESESVIHALVLPKISKFKIDKLREMCKTNGLSPAGTKDALYKRLRNANLLH